MAYQSTLVLPPFSRGVHLITQNVLKHLDDLPETGILHLFIQHTSAALALNENADPDVRIDLENALDRIAPEAQPWYTHVMEGKDDMPAHIKALLLGSAVSIPVSQGKLALGRWQGIFLCEFRDHAGPRTLIITVLP